MTLAGLSRDPVWYKDAIIYELHVRAFHDSDGDGVGDFRGLTEKLGYLQDLGVTALWLLPFYPSPLKDDGYDISDYTTIHPNYGTLRDFRIFLREAHQRGLRVITELVINHTSIEHPWFQRARAAEPGSVERNFYVWSNTPDKYPDARIIFKDFEQSNWAWDPVAQSYYWHRFYAHQPDLNFDNPAVRKAIVKIMDFWLSLGVDGLRLDAIPYLYERDGTNCENLVETHAYLKELRRHIDANYADRMLLSEANQWPEDAVAYFGAGDESHMAFHFPIMPRLFMAMRMEDRNPIVDILAQTPAIPSSCQWALFLRNHDELTLEMVTDEERDYMYRVYAQDPEARINLGIRRRLAPLLGNHRRQIELMNGLLFSLPGTPVLYYGDEIGMGDNIYLGDRNGVRTPMHWSADRNAGFSRANPQRLYLPLVVDSEYHHQALNVEAQQKNLHSLFWWTKRLIALRKRFKALAQGSIEFLNGENRKVLAFIRRHGDESILVVANLSRFSQYVELDLGAFAGQRPIEIFGHSPFPPIGELPYLLTLGPHSFYWFILERERDPESSGAGLPNGEASAEPIRVPCLGVTDEWTELLSGRAKATLESILPYYLRKRQYGGSAAQVKSATIQDVVPLKDGSAETQFVIIHVELIDGDPETYALPLAFASGDRIEAVHQSHPGAILADVCRLGRSDQRVGVIYDAFAEASFSKTLFDAIVRRRRFKGELGEVIASPTPVVRQIRDADDNAFGARVIHSESDRTMVSYGDRLLLKTFHRLSDGVSPDVETRRFLTERQSFAHISPLAGVIDYSQGRGEPRTLAILQGFVPLQNDAWSYTLDSVGQYYEQVAADPSAGGPILLGRASLVERSQDDPPALAVEMLGTYLDLARRIGERTAELHLALAAPTSDPSFTPEPFSVLYQRSIYQSMRSQVANVWHVLRSRLSRLDGETAAQARALLEREEDVLTVFNALRSRKIDALRTRCHGDYSLGQLLYSGQDLIVVDFEGELTQTLGQRRIKRSPLRDVASMIQSFDEAAFTGLHDAVKRGVVRPDDIHRIEPWARFWNSWVSATFLRAYLRVVGEASYLPRERQDLELLLNAFILDTAINDLGNALNNRPAWANVPLQSILWQLTPPS